MLLSNWISQNKPKEKLRFGLFLASVISIVGCSDLKMQQIGKETNDKLASVAIGSFGNRDEQLLNRELQRLISINGIAEAKYELKTQISYSASGTLAVQGSSSVLKRASMTVSFQLVDLASDNVQLKGSVTGNATTGSVSSLYGIDKSEQHARERLVIMLAQRTLQRLQLHFLSQKEQG
jgi:hypothetical protein